MQIWHLIKKDLAIEWRSPFLVYGALLFVLSASFASYLAFSGIITEGTWLSLLWILMIFSSLYAASQSFLRESDKEYLLLYSLVSSKQLILAKIIFQTLFQLLVTSLAFLILYGLFQPNISHLGPLMLLIAVNCLNFASLLTLMSGLAARTGKSATLLSILSLPILYPILVLGINAAKLCLTEQELPGIFYQLLGLEALIFALVFILSLVLFPYLWRD